MFKEFFRICFKKVVLYKIMVYTVLYIQINTWAFPYWPGYHPETPILA